MSENYTEFKQVRGGEEIIIRTSDVDLEIYEIGELFERFLLALTFQPSSINILFNRAEDER